jgi:hypothetical protein
MINLAKQLAPKDSKHQVSGRTYDANKVPVVKRSPKNSKIASVSKKAQKITHTMVTFDDRKDHCVVCKKNSPKARTPSFCTECQVYVHHKCWKKHSKED